MERTARGDGEAEKKREKQVLSSQFMFNVWIRCHARSPMATQCFSVGHWGWWVVVEMWPCHLPFNPIFGPHLCSESLSTGFFRVTEVTFLQIGTGLQNCSQKRQSWMFFYSWSQLSPGNLIPEEIKLRLCLQLSDYSASRGIRWAGRTSFIFLRSWLASSDLSEMSLLFNWYNWEQIWLCFTSFIEGSPEILLPKSSRLEKISRHSLSLCCFTSAKNRALEPSEMKLGNLLWQVVLWKTVDISKVVYRFRKKKYLLSLYPLIPSKPNLD